MKTVTIAIAGCGSRGKDTYAPCQLRFPQQMKIVAAADTDPAKLSEMQALYEIPAENCFASADEMIAKGRLADAMFICTPDQLHYEQAMAALQLDYHLLLEKPISPTKEECLAIEALALKRNRQVVVCHVLRYTVFYQKLKELLESGIIGETVSMQAIEMVGYWHQAHSFVRGNWRNAELSTPMILQKCCHDMDILLWLASRHCLRVSSFGSLSHFTPENAPQGAPKRCTDGCPAAASCPYNAQRFYLGKVEAGELGWPVNVLDLHPTKESIELQLRTGPYGRCVYHCDNNVVDHQVVNLELEGGLTVSLTMCGMTAKSNREIRIMGTHGEILGDMHNNLITVMPFGQDTIVHDITKLSSDFSGHGGGDARMVDDFLQLISEDVVHSNTLSSITHSVESHIVALAAEESRLSYGKTITIR